MLGGTRNEQIAQAEKSIAGSANDPEQTLNGGLADRDLWNVQPGRSDHSGLILAARITFAHFSVSEAMRLSEVRGGAPHHRTVQLGKPCFHLGVSERY